MKEDREIVHLIIDNQQPILTSFKKTMASFRLPENLLHSHIEPQWFPRPREETESG